jgi:hypothetical protein
MKTSVMTVTPQQAAEWLKKNTRNRHMSPSKVNKFARDLSAGKWPITHQSIGIGPSYVVDGQHRLAAIRESGASVALNVTIYETEAEADAAMLSIDLTDKRTVGDLLELGNIAKRGEGKDVGAVSRSLCAMGLGAAPARVSPSPQEIGLTYAREREHIDWTVRAFRVEGKKKARFRAPHMTAFAIAHMFERDRVEALAAQVREAEAPSGSVAQAYLKAEAEGKLGGRGGGQQNATIYSVLRLIQCAILDEPPPKIVRGTVATLMWFKSQIIKQRERETKALEAMGVSSPTVQ